MKHKGQKMFFEQRQQFINLKNVTKLELDRIEMQFEILMECAKYYACIEGDVGVNARLTIQKLREMNPDALGVTRVRGNEQP